MSIDPANLVTATEKLSSKPLTIGSLWFIGSIVILTFDALNIFDGKELGSVFMPAMWVGLAASIALIIWGLLIAAARGITRAGQAGVKAVSTTIETKTNNAKELKKLIENAQRLSPSAQTMLDGFMQQPSGRFLTPEWCDEFRDLCDANLVDAEDTGEVGLGIYTSQTSFAGKAYFVNPLYYEHIKKQAGRK